MRRIYILPSELKVGMMFIEEVTTTHEMDTDRQVFVVVSIGKKFMTFCRQGDPHHTYRKGIPKPYSNSESWIPEIRGKIVMYEN